MKDGKWTSEYTLTKWTIFIGSVLTVLGVALKELGSIESDNTLIVVGGAMIAVSSAVYSLGRSIAKQGESNA